MKKIYFVFVFLLAIPFSIFSQQALTISQSTVKYEGSEYPCVEVVLSQLETKEVKKAWEDFLKKEYDVNLKGLGFLVNKDVLSAEQVRFPKLSEKEMDFYTEVVEKKGDTRMSVFASLGYDIHIGPEGDYAEGFREMRSIVEDFLAQYLPEYYQDRIKKQDKEVADLLKEHTDLEETITANRSRVEELEEEIENLKKENKNLEKDLKNKAKDLAEAQEKLEASQKAFAEVKGKLNIGENK